MTSSNGVSDRQLFKVGDRVVCLDDTDGRIYNLREDTEYTVDKVLDRTIRLKGVSGGWFKTRFELVGASIKEPDESIYNDLI